MWSVCHLVCSVSIEGEKLLARAGEKSDELETAFFWDASVGYHRTIETEGLAVTETNLKSLAEKQRMGWIDNSLKAGRFVILLGKQGHEQHYVVLSAYDSVARGFQVYDSLVGRTVWSPSELLTFWSGGGLLGFYKWYAIVVDQA